MIFTLILLLFAMTDVSVLYDFSKEMQPTDWLIVNDVVMGGRSQASIIINSDGHGEFSGTVSLENNGGFASMRYRCDESQVAQFDTIVIRLKGDGKSYQFRAKTSTSDRHSYIYSFETMGEWETIEIPMSEMTPSFRGMTLDKPNYPGEKLQEVAILIGNKRPEDFKLIIDRISFK